MVVFSIEKVCEDNEVFYEQVIKGLREYAFRLKKTQGDATDRFMTKSGCEVKSIHACESVNGERWLR